jgi:hypothetical protein
MKFALVFLREPLVISPVIPQFSYYIILKHEGAKTRRKNQFPLPLIFCTNTQSHSRHAVAQFQTRSSKPENLFLYIIIYMGKNAQGGQFAIGGRQM